MSDVDLSLVEDSLLLPVSWSNKTWSTEVKRGDWEVRQLNSEIDTSLTQRVFEVLDIIRLVLIRGSGSLCVRSGRGCRGLSGS